MNGANGRRLQDPEGDHVKRRKEHPRHSRGVPGFVDAKRTGGEIGHEREQRRHAGRPSWRGVEVLESTVATKRSSMPSEPELGSGRCPPRELVAPSTSPA